MSEVLDLVVMVAEPAGGSLWIPCGVSADRYTASKRIGFGTSIPVSETADRQSTSCLTDDQLSDASHLHCQEDRCGRRNGIVMPLNSGCRLRHGLGEAN